MPTGVDRRVGRAANGDVFAGRQGAGVFDARQGTKLGDWGPLVAGCRGADARAGAPLQLCLQDDDLAKQCVPALAKELETSDDAAVRNNVAVIMADLCIRWAAGVWARPVTVCAGDVQAVVLTVGALRSYTALTEQYLPAVTSRLKDSSPLVRRQTLTLLTKCVACRRARRAAQIADPRASLWWGFCGMADCSRKTTSSSSRHCCLAC